MDYMRKIIKLTFLTILLCFIGCSSDEDGVNIQQKVLKADVNGVTMDFGDTSDEITFATATLWDNKRLNIRGQGDNTSLILTIGESFLEDRVQEGTYKIGTVQDNLETNIFYLDINDTNSGNGPYYLDIYGCNVLSNSLIGEINISRLDTENKIVSGTFNGVLFRWIDITTGELKNVELNNGVFSIPYIDESEDLNADRNLISARINGYRFVSDDPGSPESVRSISSGVDKIRINGYDNNFGRINISVLSSVESGNDYLYRPDGSFESLGVHFQNRINIPEGLLSNNPNQSNDSYISIINHDKDANIIEGNFYIENSEIEGRTIVDGYFKVNYVDSVD
ncbi:hypothetical protein D1818_21625 [Aquimarina sp. BL5]|nr:hypothetical protein D1818_21625 [Aquimarina sp. BL5]